MQATNLLKEEHQGVRLSLASSDNYAQSCRRPRMLSAPSMRNDAARLIEFFKVFVDKCHHAKEEEVLFPALLEEKDPAAAELVQVLLTEHADGRKLVTKMAEALTKFQAGTRVPR